MKGRAGIEGRGRGIALTTTQIRRLHSRTAPSSQPPCRAPPWVGWEGRLKKWGRKTAHQLPIKLSFHSRILHCRFVTGHSTATMQCSPASNPIRVINQPPRKLRKAASAPRPPTVQLLHSEPARGRYTKRHRVLLHPFPPSAECRASTPIVRDVANAGT